MQCGECPACDVGKGLQKLTAFACVQTAPGSLVWWGMDAPGNTEVPFSACNDIARFPGGPLFLAGTLSGRDAGLRADRAHKAA